MRCKRQSKHSRAGGSFCITTVRKASGAGVTANSPAGSVDEDLQSVRSTSVWSRGLLTVTLDGRPVDLDVPLPLDS